MTENKGVGFDLSFDLKALELDDDQFKNLVTEAVDLLKVQLDKARETIKATKAAEVEGTPTLAEKGVSCTTSYDGF
jgi:hypothetical protein